MSCKQLKLCEETVLEIIKANHAVYAKETPLSIAKEIQGLRAVFDEVNCAFSCCSILILKGNFSEIFIKLMQSIMHLSSNALVTSME